MATKAELDRSEKRLALLETNLNQHHINTALLLSTCRVAAEKGGSIKHAAANVKTGIFHNKRKTGAQLLGSGAGMAVGYGVSTAVGGAATATFGIAGLATLGAVTGGIAIGALLLGIGIAAGISAYRSSVKAGMTNKIKGDNGQFDYDPATLMKDLKHLLTAGEVEDLARYFDKAKETERAFKLALTKPLSNCKDAADLAHAMYTHRRRLEEKLRKGQRMEHLAMYKNLVDMKMSDTALMLEHMGHLHALNIVQWIVNRSHSEVELQRISRNSDTTDIRDYTDLKWKTWFEQLVENKPMGTKTHSELLQAQTRISRNYGIKQPAIKATIKNIYAAILHEAKHASDGDKKNIAGKVADNLDRELRKTTVSTEDVASFTSLKLLDLTLGAGKTAGTSAAKSAALGSASIGSVGNIAASAGAGMLASILVTCLFTYAFDKANDKNNAAAIDSRSEPDPVKRIWLLRSMLMTGRVETLYESYVKIQQSFEQFKAFHTRYDFVDRYPTHHELVKATTTFFRMQKHLLRMLAMGSVLSMFFDELDSAVDQMMDAYSQEGGDAVFAIDSIIKQVERQTHTCVGTCYELKARGSNGIVVANPLKA